MNKQPSSVTLSDVHVAIGEDVEVTQAGGHDLEFGLSWDFFPGMAKVDLDCSALMFDWAGVLVDACYYNQLTCCDGAIKHSGDSPDGEMDGFDEKIEIDLDSMPPAVSYMAFVVNAFQGGNFTAVESAYAVISDVLPAGTQNKPLADVSVGCGQNATGCVMAVMYKKNPMDPNSKWMFRNIGEMCTGTNFQESLPAVRKAVDSFIDPGLAAERTASMTKTFKMNKGDSIDIPADLFRGGDDLFIGLGWTCPGNLDLDAGILVMDENDKHITTVNFGDKSYDDPLGRAITHQGDNTTGDGDGDDERIDIDLDRLSPHVKKLIICVNMYSGGAGFGDVTNAYVRMCAVKNDHEFCRYTLSGGCKNQGVLFAALQRGPLGNWQLCAKGKDISGRSCTAPECLSDCGVKGKSHFKEGPPAGEECCNIM
jgi:tellurium resistance protein TerZ